MRSYTPVSPVLPHEEDGTFQLLVKTYFPSDGGPFPPGGTASNYLDLMQEGILTHFLADHSMSDVNVRRGNRYTGSKWRDRVQRQRGV